MEPQAEVKQCPRCKLYYPPHWFPEPVSICIICYERCPGNQGLTLEALYTKASKSWRAKNTQGKHNRLARVGLLAGQLAQGKPQISAAGEMLAKLMQGPANQASGLRRVGRNERTCQYCNQPCDHIYEFKHAAYGPTPRFACEACKGWEQELGITTTLPEQGPMVPEEELQPLVHIPTPMDILAAARGQVSCPICHTPCNKAELQISREPSMCNSCAEEKLAEENLAKP